MDLETQLRQLIEADFEPRALDRYPAHVAVIRDSFIALLQPTPEGLKLFSAPGRLVENQVAVLITRGERRMFQCKAGTVEADAAMLADFARFRADLERIVGSQQRN